jgi:methionyl-tRNA formyltransferase
MTSVFFLVNSKEEFNFSDYIKKYLKNISVTIDTVFPKKSDSFNLIVLWNYMKIIPNISKCENVIVFHGSDLPKGKGWAPIYYSLSKNNSHYIISGIIPNDEVDEGDIIVKAKFKIKLNYTAKIIREFDNEISFILIQKFLKRFKTKIKGKKQSGHGTFFKRRYPEDNEISFNSKISKIFNHLRASEDSHPAFFYHNDIKYLIKIEPEEKPLFPDDIEYTFFY